jgi:hypothetical protein
LENVFSVIEKIYIKGKGTITILDMKIS